MSKPQMAKRLVAVFGHYDSRGGTMAIPVKSNTMHEIKRAKQAYIREFGGDDYLVDVADEDFIRVAELWYPVGVDLPTDLNYDGPESTTAVVQSRGNNAVLEVVLIPPDLTKDLDEKQKEYEAVSSAAINAISPDAPWPSPKTSLGRIVESIRGDHYKFMKEIEAEKERRIEELATVISDAQYIDWNDDAYGFVLTE